MSDREPWSSNWKHLAKLGRGGQGNTRLVERVDGSGIRGVLKVLNRQDSPQARQRMQREVVALDTLAQGGVKVPRVLDGNTADYADKSVQLFFVMDFIHGVTLADLLKREKQLSLNQAMGITLDLCSTVSAAHEQDVLHRDLKPANIMIRNLEKADAVIVDYGLSFNRSIDLETVTQADETLRNEFLALPETNTPGGDRRDKRSDITAIGAIVYYCLTGHNPGHLRDGNGLAPHRRAGYTIRDSLAGDSRLQRVEAVLDRVFAVEVENRFQNCDELTGRLKNALLLSIPVQDPAEVAAEVTAFLRQKDRRLLVADCKRMAAQLINGIQQQISTKVHALNPFEVGMDWIDLGSDVLPEDLDKLDRGLFVTLKLSSHGVARRAVIQFAAKGSECVLLRHVGSPGMKGGAEVVKGLSWEELLWFSPDSKPNADYFRDAVNGTLNDLLRKLQDQILGQ
jgi:serine/threonine protein kinase